MHVGIKSAGTVYFSKLKKQTPFQRKKILKKNINESATLVGMLKNPRHI